MNVGLFTQKILKLRKLPLIGICGSTILSIKSQIIKILNIPGKKHLENQTGTNNSYKPIKIRKNNIKKKYETWK